MTARKPAARPAVTADDEDLTERAAVREYLGGYPRAEAERLALEDVRQMAENRRRR